MNRLGQRQYYVGDTMNISLLEKVLAHKAKGDIILMRQDYLGNGRIKIKTGPFKLFTKRLHMDQVTFHELRSRLRTSI